MQRRAARRSERITWFGPGVPDACGEKMMPKRQLCEKVLNRSFQIFDGCSFVYTFNLSIFKFGKDGKNVFLEDHMYII